MPKKKKLQSYLKHSDEKVIICADDLAPSETVLLDKDKVLAFVTAYGSSNSHTAILARNMNIPAIIGVGKEFLKTVKNGDFAAVDGYTGEIFVNPDEETKSRLENKLYEDMERKLLLHQLKGKENITLDGRKINIFANIGSIDNIGAVLANDAGGIGLFRSEFLYLENNDYPTEEQQFVDTHHEAILRLIEMSAKNAHENGGWIGICGELAADTSLIETFLRMGIDELSVSPSFILSVRNAVRHCDLSKK